MSVNIERWFPSEVGPVHYSRPHEGIGWEEHRVLEGSPKVGSPLVVTVKANSPERAKQRAQLIAAAPELLDALVAAKDFICQTDKYKTGHTGAADVVNAAVLAIAKATL